MHFVNVSKTRGVNLAQVIEWYDFPDAKEPWITLTTTGGTQTEMGERTPYDIRLTGEERLTMLEALDRVSRPSFALTHA
jgi:hypothetical protein